MPAKTQCPHCQKILKLKSEAAFGREVPCPQCKTRFTVEPFKAKKKKKKAEPAPPPEDEWEDYGESYDDYGDEEYGYDDYDYEDYGADEAEEEAYVSPSRKSSSKKGKSSKKKKKAAGLPPWLTYVAFGLIGVLVLGGVAGGIVMVVGSLGGSNVIDLTWLPENSDLFIRIEPDELWEAPMLASARESDIVKNVMAKAAADGGIDLTPADIDSVTMAGIDVVDLYEQKVNLFGGSVGAPTIAKQADAKMLAVIRLKKDITEDELTASAGNEKKDHNGKSYFTAADGQAVYMADARTLIAGEESQVQGAMDRGPVEPRVERLDFINPEHHLVMAIAPPQMLKPESAADAEPTATGGAGQKIEAAMNANTKWTCFGLSLTSDIEMEVQFLCYGDSEAQNLKGELDSVLTELKSQFEASTGQVPPQMATFVEIGQEAINSLAAESSGDEVKLAGKVPGRITTAVEEAIESNPLAAMMLQGMTQGLQSGQGMPPGGNPLGGASLNPSPDEATAGTNPQGGGDPEDFERAVMDERKETLNTLDGIRGQIKSTTGSIQNAVPGGK